MSTEVRPVEHQVPQRHRLKHTCALHPRICDGPHHEGCYALCGHRPSIVCNDNPVHVRDADSCVVCDALFDAQYRR